MYMKMKGIDPRGTPILRQFVREEDLQWTYQLYMNDIEIVQLEWFRSDPYQDVQSLSSLAGLWLVYRQGWKKRSGTDTMYKEFHKDHFSCYHSESFHVVNLQSQNTLEAATIRSFNSLPKTPITPAAPDASQDYFRYLDSSGGFWLHRWGDHAVRTIAVGMWLPEASNASDISAITALLRLVY